MKSRVKVKSIFRYPGGKSRALDIVLAAFPRQGTWTEYREPFAGAGWVGLQVDRSIVRHMNDKDVRLLDVYREVRDRPEEFIEAVRAVSTADEQQVKARFHDALDLLSVVDQFGQRSWLRREDVAVAYFLANRLGWGGRVKPSRRNFSGFEKVVSVHRPELVRAMSERLQGVRLTSLDFEALLSAPATEDGGKVFLYCDPPYISDALRHPVSQLYQHAFTLQDHERLAAALRACRHRWLLSLDDHPLARRLYADYTVIPVVWPHTIGATPGKLKDGKELLISNYI